MKKTFESFQPCLELREIIFLRTLPHHQHLVQSLDIFLDPLTKKLHIAMEYMDGNLYQLMKARDHKVFDGSSVKSILFQILAGLDHIHNNGFFHRDIKPENILVTVSAHQEVGSAFKRYSQLVTPPSTPPSYTIKIADFGLARETSSKSPYTTYVSTRWYRAPEVLLRAGEYSAPVDIWALGAMAVEVATLKPLFPGGNEVDQVWRICEIMGSPGVWVNKKDQRVGGGDWKEGVKLAQKLGFSFPKMTPHTLDTILQPPTWPPALANFVTWCLMWDPKARPNCQQAMAHEFFQDAVDPLRPKSSGSRLLGRKSSHYDHLGNDGNPSLSSKTSSWFRRSLAARESAPAVPQQEQTATGQPPLSPQQSPTKPPAAHAPSSSISKSRPAANKRNTWTVGQNANNAAPMPILPSIRPISPLSAAVTAQAHAGAAEHARIAQVQAVAPTPIKKIGRQLSQASQGNHYSDMHRQDAERALNGEGADGNPKESFFSHFRKRARRLSGRHHTPMSPRTDDVEANAGRSGWVRQSGGPDMMKGVESTSNMPAGDMVDQALHSVKSSLELGEPPAAAYNRHARQGSGSQALKRHHSLPQGQLGRISPGPTSGVAPSRSVRRAAQKPALPTNTYETPLEQEELLDEALNSAQAAAAHFDRQQQHVPAVGGGRQAGHPSQGNPAMPAPYPTPSPSAKRNSVAFGSADQNLPSKPIEIHQAKGQASGFGTQFPFPTPPDDNEWAAAAAASMGLGDHWTRYR